MRLMFVIWTIFILSLALIGTLRQDDRVIRASTVEYILDHEARYDSSSIRTEDFQPFKGSLLPPQPGKIWVRIAVPTEFQKQDEPFVLFTGSNEMVLSMRAYLSEGGAIRPIGNCDLRLEAKECAYSNLQYAFPLELPKNAANAAVLIEAVSGMAPIQNEFFFMTKPYYNRVNIFLTTTMGISTGVSLLIAGLGFGLFMMMRDPTFFFFGLYSLFGFLSSNTYRGVWDAFKPNSDWVAGSSFYLALLIFGRALELQFIRDFFRMPEHNPWINRVFLGLIVVLSALAVASLSMQSLLWPYVANGLLAESLGVFTVLLYFIHIKRRNVTLFCLSWSTGLLGYALWALYRLGVFNNQWIMAYMPLITRPLQVFFLVYILIQRLRELSDEVASADAKEQKNNVVRTLLRVLAHDLSNTTNVILISADLATDATKKNDSPKLSRNLERIARAANVQADIIHNAKRSFSHSEPIDFKQGAADVVECIESAISIHDTRFVTKDIRLVKDFNRQPIWVAADPTGLTHQVLSNLIDNALKFTPSGKSITIRAFKEPKTEAVIEVIDEGVGMPPELVERLFEENTRQSRMGTENEKGTGQGLLIVRDFVKAFGGSIVVASGGEGTKFILRFKSIDQPSDEATSVAT